MIYSPAGAAGGVGGQFTTPALSKISDITAIIINWNTSDLLRKCIESFRSGNIPARNIILVDQSSTDGSAAIVRRKFRGVRVLSNPNVGYAHAVNAGMAFVKTPFAVICNADTMVHNDCLDRLRNVFEDDNRVALAGCTLVDEPGRNVTQFSRTSVTRGLLLEIVPGRLRGTWRDTEQLWNRKTAPFDVTYVEGAFFMVRTNACRAVGGMDEGFSFFFEDADLSLRLIKAGFRVIHVPGARATHIRNSSFSQVPIRRASAFYSNMIRLYLRHALRRAVILKIGLNLITLWKSVYFRIGSGERFSGKAARNEALREALGASQGHERGREEKNNPFVSVIIPTANRPAPLKRLLKSLDQQSYKHFEIIAADQSDEQVSLRKTAKNKARIKSIPLTIKDRALAKNAAAAAARGDILLFCDDDIIVPETFIEAHVISHKNPAVGGVSCRIVEDGLPATTSQNICRTAFYGRSIPGFQSDTTCFIETLVGANMSVKRHVRAECGFFDSTFRGTAIFEEQDYSERIRTAGYRILFTNRATVEHVPQEGGNLDARRNNAAEYYKDFHHNELLFFLKNRHRVLLIFVIPFCFLRSVKQSVIHHQGVRGLVRMFGGVFSGIGSYYRSLR